MNVYSLKAHRDVIKTTLYVHTIYFIASLVNLLVVHIDIAGEI